MLSGILTRAWEFDEDFDQIISNGAFLTNSIQWVASEGTPIKVGREMVADEVLQRRVACVEQGEAIFFPKTRFISERASYILNHRFGRPFAERNPSTTKTEVLGWIRDR